jgi:hypothetical protein
MVGSTIRLSNTILVPTALEGLNAFAVERQIDQVLSASQCTVDTEIPDTYSNVGYIISDPLDIDVQAMFNPLFVGAMKWLFFSRDRKEYDKLVQSWLSTLAMGKEADMRNAALERASLWGPYRQRNRDMPRGADIS